MRRITALITAAVAIVALAGSVQAAPLQPSDQPPPGYDVPQVNQPPLKCGDVLTSGKYKLTSNLQCGKGEGLRIVGPYVTLDLNGYSISGDNSQGNGVWVQYQAHDAVVKNGSIRGFFYGVSVQSDDTTVAGVDVRDSAWDGVYLGGSRNTLSYSTISNSPQGARLSGANATVNGTDFTNTTTGVVIASSGATVTGGIFDKHTWGVETRHTASGARIEYNLIQNARLGVWLQQGSNHQVVGNDITGSVFNDIVASGVQGLLIEQNRHSGSGQEAISLTGNGATVTSNTINEAGSHGIAVNGKGNAITANTVTGSKSHGIWIAGASSKTIVSGNATNNNVGAGIYDEAKGTTITGNTANDNGDHNPQLGIKGGKKVKGGGNTAEGNTDAAQCNPQSLC